MRRLSGLSRRLAAWWRPPAGRIAAGTGLIVFALWLGGFVRFTHMVGDLAPADDTPRGDGIVVLTGGSVRLATAVSLIERGRARRLLITGVHATTTRGALRRVTGGRADVFTCCVDIDRQARNTVDNAHIAARWAQDHGYDSLILVTANYHMPRSLVEFARVLPDIDLIPYPVAPRTIRPGRWWPDHSLRVLAVEYTKYVVSLLRARLARPSSRGRT